MNQCICQHAFPLTHVNFIFQTMYKQQNLPVFSGCGGQASMCLLKAKDTNGYPISFSTQSHHLFDLYLHDHHRDVISPCFCLSMHLFGRYGIDSEAVPVVLLYSFVCIHLCSCVVDFGTARLGSILSFFFVFVKIAFRFLSFLFSFFIPHR